MKIIYANGAASEFVYDGFGRRVKILEREDLGALISERRYIWAGGAQPTEIRDGSNTVLRRFFGAGEEIAGSDFFYTSDHLGSVREMLDSSGSVRARYDYDPYGNFSKVSGDLDSTFGFTRFFKHTNSDLDLTQYRAYDSANGRWLSRDPLGEMAGANLYGYVLGNPINLYDAYGLDWLTTASNFSVGFGDHLSFGLTKKFRQALGYDDVVDKCSGACKGGEYAGMAADLIMSGGSLALGKTAANSQRGCYRKTEDLQGKC